jgi:hypothetical protein
VRYLSIIDPKYAMHHDGLKEVAGFVVYGESSMLYKESADHLVISSAEFVKAVEDLAACDEGQLIVLWTATMLPHSPPPPHHSPYPPPDVVAAWNGLKDLLPPAAEAHTPKSVYFGILRRTAFVVCSIVGKAITQDIEGGARALRVAWVALQEVGEKNCVDELAKRAADEEVRYTSARTGVVDHIQHIKTALVDVLLPALDTLCNGMGAPAAAASSHTDTLFSELSQMVRLVIINAASPDSL